MALWRSPTRPKGLGCRAAQDAVRILAVALALFNVPWVSMAQSQFSTLNGAHPRLDAISAELLYGVSFVTDNNDYILDSITLRVVSGSSTPVTFTGALYPGSGIGQSELEQLGGNSTITTRNTLSDLTFTSGAETLFANTRYTVIFSSDSPASVVSYGAWIGTGPWSLTTPYASLDAWGIYSLNAGTTWSFLSPPLAFSVEATTVPEPSSEALILLGVVAFCIRDARQDWRLSGRLVLLQWRNEFR
jgi:hypothetical protein